MKQVCIFCKERDKERCVPGLAVDLQAAIESGVVLDTGVVEDFNNIDDPNNVHVRVRDVFDAINLQRAYLENGRIKDSSLSGSSESTSTMMSSGAATVTTQS